LQSRNLVGQKRQSDIHWTRAEPILNDLSEVAGLNIESPI